jgi:hypothetical protein
MKIFPSIIKRTLVGIFIIFNLCAITQPFDYFNNRYDISEVKNQDESYTILRADPGYITASTSLAINNNMYWWKMKLSKFDSLGTLQNIKTIGEDSIHYMFPYIPRCLVKRNSNYYCVGQKRTPAISGAKDEGILLCLNENLDTLWTKLVGENNEPYDTSFFFSSLQNINQDFFILTGGWKPYGIASNVLLLKTDTLGNQVWYHSYDYYGFYIEGYCVIQTDDQGFAIGCFKQTPGYPASVDPIIIKTDSLGNQEWTKNLGGPFKDFTPMISLSQEGNIIVGTSYGDSMYTPDIPLSRINIIKLDNDGNIIWNKKYGTSQPGNYLRNIKTLDDGSIIAVGGVRKFNPAPDRVGWILKTDLNGDSLWYREYSILPGQESSNFLYDVIPTLDNGLIACGYVDPSLPDTGSVDTWIIKLDSIGCDSAGCDTTVGVKEHGGMEAWGHGRMEVWPNPAREVINFKFSILNSGRDYSISIYDIFGREVQKIKVQDGQEMVQVNVNGFSPGVYIAILKKGFDLVESRKFVVAR